MPLKNRDGKEGVAGRNVREKHSLATSLPRCAHRKYIFLLCYFLSSHHTCPLYNSHTVSSTHAHLLHFRVWNEWRANRLGGECMKCRQKANKIIPGLKSFVQYWDSNWAEVIHIVQFSLFYLFCMWNKNALKVVSQCGFQQGQTSSNWAIILKLFNCWVNIYGHSVLNVKK